MLVRAFFFVSLLLVAAPAEAGFFARTRELCQKLFARAAPRNSPLSAEERELFARAFGTGGTHPYSAEANLDEEVFYTGFLRLPEPIRHRLLKLPPGKTVYRAAEDLALEPGPRSFLDQILKRLDRNGLAEVTTKLAAHETRRGDDALRAALNAKWELSVRRGRARAYFDLHAGEVKLDLHERRGKKFLRVADAEYPAREEGNSLIVEVPREKVAHPFWNPVAPEKVAEMIRAGVRPPPTYETLLGHDGKFYLVDGNHRFDLDPKRTVSVRIAEGHSVNLRAMLDLIGAPQPTTADDILDYVEGRISWEAFVPATQRNTFVLPPASPAPPLVPAAEH